jgi:2,4-dienoyl-CoA reductase-like NADH-dependent reductase (Old Yellow Enzyme family)
MLKSAEDENYYLPNVKVLKPVMKNRPLILMGGVRNPLSAESILKENIADFIAMSRPLIYEPELPNRWKSGDISPALCISCNACLGATRTSKTYCVTKKKLEERK